jgi:Family of unknown function (DUF7010)
MKPAAHRGSHVVHRSAPRSAERAAVPRRFLRREAEMTNMEVARREVSESSAGGAPLLFSFGASLLACGGAAFFLSRRQAALAVMFQGGLALPIAFLLERRLGWGPMAADNPLRALSIQLAMSQICAFPVVVAMYDLNPGVVPLAMASIAGGHFLPYAWLQRTSVYVWLAVSVPAGALALQVVLGARAFPFILLYMTACYWMATPLVYRAARRLTA